MHFNSAVLISSVFASAVLADSDSIWAGNIFTLDPHSKGTFQSVSGTIRIPDISDQQVGSSGVALVGIGGTEACLGGMLQLGVVFNVTTEGPSYTPMFRYGSGTEGSFNDVNIAAGHAIKLTVNAPVAAMFGNITVENLSNGQSASGGHNLIEAVCGKTAEWVVGKMSIEGPLVNLGTLTFANAEVGGNDFGPQNLIQNIQNITENYIPLTSVSVTSNSVTVTWV